MGSILQPVIASKPPTFFGVNFLPVQSDKRPFTCWHAKAVHLLFTETKIEQFADGVQLDVDANPSGLGCSRFHTQGSLSDLMQRQGRSKAANSTASNDHALICHLPSS